MKRFSALVTAIIVILSISVKSQYLPPNTDSLEFPFIERFTEGSLEVNNWVTDCENWSIENGDGIPAPSVRFTYDPELGTDYNCTLTSDWISKDSANMYLKFEYKVLAEFYTEEDNLYVEIFDSVDWTTIGLVTYYYEYWHDWKRDLTPYINNSQFKIRFRANGNNSSNLDYLAIDNIFLFDGIEFPGELTGEYYFNNEFGVDLHWTLDRAPGAGGWGSPLSYSFESHCEELGLSNGGDWAYAAKWDEVANYYDTTYLYIVQTYIGDTDFNKITLNIWKGQFGTTKIFSKNVTNEVEADQWNSFWFVPTQMLIDTAPTWIGFEIYGQEMGAYPAGISCNDAEYGYGNLIKYTIDSPWDTLPSSYDHNWSIVCWIQSRPSFYDLDGYMVYRKVDIDTAYSFLDYADNDFDEGEYLDEDVNIQTSYTYQVRASWTNPWIIPADTLFSIPGYAKVNSDDNFVSVLVTDYSEQIIDESFLIVYPNPFSNSTTIEYTLLNPQTVKITFYNQLGKQVDVIEQQQSDGLQKVVWTPELPVGIYYYRLEAGEQLATGKLVLIE